MPPPPAVRCFLERRHRRDPHCRQTGFRASNCSTQTFDVAVLSSARVLLNCVFLAPPPSRPTVAPTRARAPSVKGPDLDAIPTTALRRAEAEGADESVILTPTTATWLKAHRVRSRGGAADPHPPRPLPPSPAATASRPALPARAGPGALGVDLLKEAVTPVELDGTEIWAVNALHGLRIVTGWNDGPPTRQNCPAASPSG